LDDLLALLATTTPAPLADGLQAAGGPGTENIAAHLARVLDHLQEDQAEAADWIAR
jgi:hypothetical protein